MLFIRTLQVAALVVCVSSILSVASVATAAVIIVNTTDDRNDGVCDVDCTLREAIIKANGSAEADEIRLVAGPVYTLTIAGTDDLASRGDLDIRGGDLIIAGSGKTIVVNNAEWAFDVDTFSEGITVEIRDLTIRGGPGGVRARSSARLKLIDVTIDGLATLGVLNEGRLELQRCVISNCQIGVVAASSSTSLLRHCVVRDNAQTLDPTAQGAGVVVKARASVDIFDSLIAGNRSLRNGGGIFAQSATLNITDSRITGNRCGLGGMDGLGAGVSARGVTMTITRCLVDHNVAVFPAFGGGIFINDDSFDPAIATITNTTISNNTAPILGGLSAGSVTDVLLDSCTITRNAATTGRAGGLGAPQVAGPVLRMRNTIISDNTAAGGAPDCLGMITSLGYNLIGNTAECTIAVSGTGDLLNIDPLLGPLLDNGGGTLTHALPPASPAIDAADPLSFPANDQRRFTRPVDGNDDLVSLPDIGAFEWPADCNGNATPDNIEMDSDGDGLIDACDGCPDDANKTVPGACGCGLRDVDSDGDGTLDCNDNCPGDPTKVEQGACGCGVSDIDTDEDGTADCNDTCPVDPDKVEPGLCGCGVVDDPTDSDGDTVVDCVDGCPDDPDKTAPGICGCGVSDGDTDGDGVLDCNDVCQGGDDNLDCDGDGTPDFCDTEADCNGNGKSDACDIDPSDPDGDGIVAPDCNHNLIPDECEVADGLVDDCNLNGRLDTCEMEPLTIVYDVLRDDLLNITGECPANSGRTRNDTLTPFGFMWQDRGQGAITFLEIAFQTGWNCHTAGTALSSTLNGEPDTPFSAPERECLCVVTPGLTVTVAATPENYLPGQINTFLIADPTRIMGFSPNALWGVGVYARVTVSFDQAAVTDCNDNGELDVCEITAGTAADCDLNGVVDTCEPDCNANGTVDACDIDETDPDGDLSVSADCDANGVPDECQADCNHNGVPDSCDVDPGDPDGDGLVSADCGVNGIPDECEKDCDGNGVPDGCDLDPTDPDGDGLVAPDCNGTGVIDSCEISSDVSSDCDENLTPDECDFLAEMIYDIAVDQGVNVFVCNASNLMGNMPSFGYAWTDTTPGPVVDVIIELNIGAQCETAGTEHATTLNGAAADTYVAPQQRCNCSTDVGIVVRLGASATDYLTGQENTFLLTGMPVSNVGFAPTGPLGPDIFGRVTVRFDNSALVDTNGDGILDVCESPADFDGSGAVDLDDFALLEPCLGGPGGGIPVGCENFDANSNGQVGLDDYGILQVEFNPPPP